MCSLYRKPENSRIRITADTRYKLYVNDVFIQFGPSKGDDKIRYIDEMDIGDWLHEGENVIAVNVLRYSYDHPYHSNHSLFASRIPGLYVEGPDLKWKSHIVRTVRFEGEEGGFAPLHVHERIATDPSARGWKTGGFDDSGWDDVKFYSEAELPLILKPENLAERTIPYMRRSKVSFRSVSDKDWDALIRGNGNAAIPENSDISVTFDAGEEMTAFPHMKMLARAGTNIEILYSECYTIPSEHGTVKGNRLDSDNGILEGYTDTYYISLRCIEWAGEHRPFCGA